ncbi:calcium permeable stress-gated cation channel 1 [Oryzias latipes]|uniref:Transmembrane protein 63C n=1 Tax=Oryzias latipes TaxID=8090 RepID=H2MNP7_ORYLA|nr:calcium permeable stress-gated cation channel 1 [Oryzias latipes]XP_023807333.1 calcium permeable stress-gated cation channel 1 [Oryzias latipes]XP_023807334.1 calcium permeable stress-gated cation channel 1 [Oryzias latipes]XP_023807335.1 calcium permeable stress-gated cation channel 1 [Oryzias latipes]XP_023807336.1 calcium permeable stress-gated cation channel 1 [Oryzias latipes]XP_023807337.1 calcium permeable stress-gated cation channel 1 [Oryzias latipes]XP_023807338.1 calcium permea
MALTELFETRTPSLETWPLELDVLGFPEARGEENSTAERCFHSHSRSSVLQGLPFGGVPTVLAINVVLWMFLLLIFSCLRKAAWDYGRLALLMENDSLTSLFYGEPSEKEKTPSETSPSDSDTKDMGFCSWLLSLYYMKDGEIRSKCGIDAVTYLSFQRHIILLMTVVSLLSLAVILPVNFSGNLLGDSPQNFGRTTLANVSAKDNFLWLHSIFALVYFIITMLCMAHHAIRLEYREDEKVARTLMITSIPREICDPGLITKHFHEAYPSCTVTDNRFCFDVHKLIKLDLERRKAMKGRLYFTTKAQKEGKIMIKTHLCAHIFGCDICGFERVDAEQYYSELEEKRTDEFNAEKSRISLKRLGIAFVTFRDERMTAVIVKDYSRVRCRRRPQQSSITTVVQSHKWGVSYAPAPSDIIWENLSVCGSRWWLRCVLLNILLFLLLFFLTTPAIIVNTMDKFNVTRPVESLRSPVITQFLPTLLLWAFSVLLPFIVYYSAFFESHWTRSGQNQVTMHKCFLLLVFMVIILPSLGLSSLDLFFTWLFDVNFLEEKEVKFQCVFLPDNGAFFVNYVITSSLIGTSMELLRIPALTVYAFRLCFAKSQAERIHVKKSQAYEFQFGLEYAWTMCIFAVSMTYSITCPIITPFGLLYAILKHMVDRYNIYYAYIPTKLNQRIHRAATSQVIVAPILCIFWLLFFSVLRLGPVHPITIFTLVSLISCIACCLFRLCLRKTPDKSTSYQMSDQPADATFTDADRSTVTSTTASSLFVASVLLEPELALTPMPSPAHHSYGALSSSQSSNHSPVAEGEGEEGRAQTRETELQEPADTHCSSPLMDSPVGYQ